MIFNGEGLRRSDAGIEGCRAMSKAHADRPEDRTGAEVEPWRRGSPACPGRPLAQAATAARPGVSRWHRENPSRGFAGLDGIERASPRCDGRWIVRALRAWALGCVTVPVALTVAETVMAADTATPCADSVPPKERFEIRFEPLGPNLWWIPAQPGESSAANRGHVVNLVLARHQGRLWLVGSGPSPAFARALRCRAWQTFGLDIGEVADPYARAEYTLGNAGLPKARVVAPAPVAKAMRAACPVCVERLRARLGDAAVDLGPAPVRLPQALPVPARPAATARWGPFEWRLLARAEAAWSSVWRHGGVTMAPGLLWFDGPPDARDTDPRALMQSLETLLAGTPAGQRFIGDAGPPGDEAAVRRQWVYWQRLWRAAQQGVASGTTLAGQPPQDVGDWVGHERHALNWQRAWRLAEDALLSAPLR